MSTVTACTAWSCWTRRFDDVNSVDEGVFKQTAIWGTVYQVQNSGGSLDQYERDPTPARP